MSARHGHHDGDVTTARVAEDGGAQVPALPLGISPHCVPGSPRIWNGGGGNSAQRFSSAGEEKVGRDPMGVRHGRKPGKPGLFSLAK